MGDAKKPFPDPLVRQRLFPDPAQIFAFGPIRLQDAITEALVVVDTNVLLLPYSTGRASLDQIRSTYERLTKENRLRIPGQVAREFADNRAEKIKTLFQQLSRKRDANIPPSQYPLLEGNPEYAAVTRREGELSAALDEYRKAISALLDAVAAWQWDDPVSKMYRDLFKPDAVIDPPIDRDKCLQELKYRQEHRIPPGYKDATNEYSGVGDFLIWKTILAIGEKESQHLIFVSGDEKTDWRYQSENRALYPRIELLEEYRCASNGKSLFIITFAELLEQLGVPAPVVKEVRQEEEAAVSSLGGGSSSSFDVLAFLGEPMTPSSLSRYLYERYPTRRQSDPDSLGRLLVDLRRYGVHNFADLNQMLDTAAKALVALEATRATKPISTGNAVRYSLALVNEKYQTVMYPKRSDFSLIRHLFMR